MLESTEHLDRGKLPSLELMEVQGSHDKEGPIDLDASPSSLAKGAKKEDTQTQPRRTKEAVAAMPPHRATEYAEPAQTSPKPEATTSSDGPFKGAKDVLPAKPPTMSTQEMPREPNTPYFKEYSLNHNMKPYMIYAIFLN